MLRQDCRAPFGRRGVSRVAYIVDDECFTRALLSELVIELGYLTREFGQASDLAAALEVQDPDLIILDLALGDSDAIEVLERLRSLSFAGRVMLISGHDAVMLTHVQRIGEQSGLAMLPFLHKPFGIEALRATLAPPMPASTIEIDLDEALRNKWLDLWYQPKFDARSRLLRGAEGLVRMRHPTWGIVPPSRFVPAADGHALRLLSEFVVEHALADWSKLAHECAPIELAINVPVTVLQDLDFVRFFRDRLPHHPRFPGLIVEIDEIEAIHDLELARDIALELRLYNIRISIDDMTSLAALEGRERFPFAELKVDQQFVSGCASDRLKHALCQTIVDIAHQLNVQAVAEGVETQADLNAARTIGFDQIQGFLLGRPMCRSRFVRTMLPRFFLPH